MKRLGAALIPFVVSLAACNGVRYKGSPVKNYDSSQLSYGLVDQVVFQPRCMSCHAAPKGGFACDSYQNVKAKIVDIQRVALNLKSMPPGGALPAEEAKLLADWIAAGAPETAGIPPPPPPPLEPRFASIKNLIFKVRCIGCHSPGQSAFLVPLETKEDLINSPRELVLPGNSAESGLMIALQRSDSKRMPPATAGPALSDTQIAIIAKWIDNGAKD